jgi:hypothetical protein
VNQHLVAVVSAMVLREAYDKRRGADWVASMVHEACITSAVPGHELDTALDMLWRERAASGEPRNDR